MALAPNDYYNMDKFKIEDERPLLQREQKAIRLIKKYSSGNKLLDIGCGNALFLEAAAKVLGPKLKYYGVDYSRFRLKQAKKRTDFEFEWCNLEKGIPYPDKQFDIIYSGEVIEHLYNPDFMLTECNRVIKKDGLLVITTPNLVAWYNRILVLLGVQPIFYETSTKSAKIGAGLMRGLKRQDVPVGHLRLFTKAALRDLLENEGFTIVEMKGANFQALPAPIRKIDTLISSIPSLASNLIIVARKK